jgi:hypothetical protein
VAARGLHYADETTPQAYNKWLLKDAASWRNLFCCFGNRLSGGIIAVTSADNEGIFLPAGTIYASYAVTGGFICELGFLSREAKALLEEDT